MKQTKLLTLLSVLTVGTSNAQNLITNGSFEDNYYANTGAPPVDVSGSTDGRYSYLLANTHGEGISVNRGAPAGQPDGWVAYATRSVGVHQDSDPYFGSYNSRMWANGGWTEAGGVRDVDTLLGREDPSIYQYGSPWAVPDEHWALSAQAGSYFGQAVEFIPGETYTLSFMSRVTTLDNVDLGIGTTIEQLYDPVTDEWQSENDHWLYNDRDFVSDLGVVTYGDAAVIAGSTGIIGEELDPLLWRETTIEFVATEDMDGIYFAVIDKHSSQTGNILLDSVSLIGPAVVPEPSASLLASLSLILSSLYRRRK